jgi:hypothetical protein
VRQADRAGESTGEAGRLTSPLATTSAHQEVYLDIIALHRKLLFRFFPHVLSWRQSRLLSASLVSLSAYRAPLASPGSLLGDSWRPRILGWEI